MSKSLTKFVVDVVSETSSDAEADPPLPSLPSPGSQRRRHTLEDIRALGSIHGIGGGRHPHSGHALSPKEYTPAPPRTSKDDVAVSPMSARDSSQKADDTTPELPRWGSMEEKLRHTADRVLLSQLLLDRSSGFAIATFLVSPRSSSPTSTKSSNNNPSPKVPDSDSNDIATAVVDFFSCEGSIAALCQHLLSSEIQVSASSQTVFRAESATTAVLRVLFRRVGALFLNDVLCNALRDVVRGRISTDPNPKVANDVGPSSAGLAKSTDSSSTNNSGLEKSGSSDKKRVKNQQNLFDVVAALIRFLTIQLDELPQLLADIFAIASTAARKRFPASKSCDALANLFFLRFVCPAIVSPREYGVRFSTISNVADDVHRADRMRIAKLLQAVASNVAETGDALGDKDELTQFIAAQREHLTNWTQAMEDRRTPAIEPETEIVKACVQGLARAIVNKEMINPALPIDTGIPQDGKTASWRALDTIVLQATRHKDELKEYLLASAPQLWVVLRDIMRRAAQVDAISDFETSSESGATGGGARRRRGVLGNFHIPGSGGSGRRDEIKLAQMALDAERDALFMQQQLLRHVIDFVMPKSHDALWKQLNAQRERLGSQLEEERNARRQLQKVDAHIRESLLPEIVEHVETAEAMLASQKAEYDDIIARQFRELKDLRSRDRDQQDQLAQMAAKIAKLKGNRRSNSNLSSRDKHAETAASAATSPRQRVKRRSGPGRGSSKILQSEARLPNTEEFASLP